MGYELLTYREHRHISELPDEARHGVNVIVHAPEQNRLVPDNDTSLKELLASHLRNPGDLIGMVEVRVQRHGLARLLGLVGDADESVDPRVSRVEDPVGAHG